MTKWRRRVEAKEKELKNWEDFGVYKEVPDEGQKTLQANWVLVESLLMAMME